MVQSIQQPTPEELTHLRLQAKQLFSSGKFTEAVNLYSILEKLAPQDHTVFSNRAAALLKLGQPDVALQDAQTTTQLAPGWAKGWYRQGVALSIMERHSQAAAAFTRALELEPSSKELQTSLDLAKQKAKAQQHARRVQRDLQAMHTSWALTTARQAKERSDMVRQLEQGMVGYPWEPEDWEWRPTWPPARPTPPPKLLTAPDTPAANGADAVGERQQGQQEQQEQQQAEKLQNQSPGTRQHLVSFLASYTHALADLEAPRATALGIAQDANLLHFYASAVEHALERRPGAHVLVLGQSGGVLALLAAAAGAGRVTDVAKSPLLHRMAQVLLQGNRDAMPGVCERVQLAHCALEDCWLAGHGPRVKETNADVAKAAGAAWAASVMSAAPGRRWEVSEPAQVLVTDLFGCGKVGLDVLKAIETAVAHGLVACDAVIVPAGISVRAALLEARTTSAAGFDVSPLNHYRWYPAVAAVDLASDKGMQLLSASEQVATTDLQQYMQSMLDGQAKPSQRSSNGPEAVQFHITKEGVVTGVASWLQLHSAMGDISTYADDAVTNDGTLLPLPIAQCAKQGLQYLDDYIPVHAGQQVTLVLQHSSGSLRVWMPDPVDDSSSAHDTAGPLLQRLRHASLPNWHFDMVADAQRNNAYDAAIRRAVAKQRALVPPGAPVRALDIGAGTGLLSLMAARAGADEVTAVESVGHLAEVAEHVIAFNGGSHAITVVHKDGRYLTTGTQPDGRPGDMTSPADLLVFEVFDSGLIGEGALHIITAARARLLSHGATIVPSAAKVFCQPIQYKRNGTLQTSPACNTSHGSLSVYDSIDLASLNRFSCRPGYFGADLSCAPGSSSSRAWQALAPPTEVMAFDFTSTDPHAAFQSTEVALDFETNGSGVVNAVAFWFELQLDEEVSLNTGPYAGAGATWQQAIQYVPERSVAQGDTLRLMASHDTYSISFRLMDELATGPASQTHAKRAAAVAQSPCSNGGCEGALLAAEIGDEAPATVHGTTQQQQQHQQHQSAAHAAAGMVDPVWHAHHQQLEVLGQGLASSMARDPLEYRKLASAALELAASPHDLGADAAQAAALCSRMMV